MWVLDDAVFPCRIYHEEKRLIINIIKVNDYI